MIFFIEGNFFLKRGRFFFHLLNAVLSYFSCHSHSSFSINYCPDRTVDLTAVTNVSESTTSAVEHEGENDLFGAEGDESDPDYNPVHLADLTAEDESLVKGTRNLLSNTWKDLIVGVSALIELYDLFQKTWKMFDYEEANMWLEYQRTASPKITQVTQKCQFQLIEATKVLGVQFNTVKSQLPCTKEKQYHYHPSS